MAELDGGVASARGTGHWSWRGLTHLWEAAGAVALVALMLHTVGNALSRSITDSPWGGTLEYVEFWYLPLIAFMGMVTAQAQRGHVEARLLFDRLPATAQVIVQVVAYLLTLAIFLAFGYFSALEAMEARDLELTGGISEIPIWQAMFVVPAAFFAMSLFVAGDLTRHVMSIRGAADRDVHRSTPSSGGPA